MLFKYETLLDRLTSLPFHFYTCASMSPNPEGYRAHSGGAARSRDRLPRWAPLLLSSRPFPAGEPLASAPFDRDQLTATAWFDPSSLDGHGPTLTLAEILGAMLGSAEAAAPVVEEVCGHPDGAWVDLEVPQRDLVAGGALPVGAFHRRALAAPDKQILLAWYGQRLPQLEDEARRLRVDLEQVRRALTLQEGALRLERNRVECLLEAARDPVSVQDTDYRILAQNEAHRRLFGDRRGEACYQVYRERGEPCAACRLSEALASGEAATLEDRPAEGPCAGSEVRIRLLPLYGPDSSAAGAVEVFSPPARTETVETVAVERDVEVMAPPALRLRDYELQHILEVLEHSGGNRAQAARLLGISRATLWRRLGPQQPRRSRVPQD